MDTVSVSLEVLGGILGKSTSELQAALMSDGNDGKKILIDQSNIDKYVAESLRGRLSEQKKAGEKEHSSFGKRTAWDEVENYLIENYGIQKGVDWKTGIASVVTEAKAKAVTSEEAVKSHDAYKAIVQKLQEAEAAHTTTKKEFREKVIQNKFSSTISSVISDESLALALPDDKSIRENQLESFRIYLAAKAKLDLTDSDDLIPVGPDGKQLEDQNYLPMKLEKFIAGHAKSFWPSKQGQDGRQAPPVGDGSTPNGTPGSDGNKFPVWKDAQEFSTFMDNAMLEGKEASFMEQAMAAYESQPK